VLSLYKYHGTNYRFLHSCSVSSIWQRRRENYSYMSQSAIKLKYDRLTCAICRLILNRYRFLGQISKNSYCMRIWNVIVKQFTDKHYAIHTGHTKRVEESVKRSTFYQTHVHLPHTVSYTVYWGIHTYNTFYHIYNLELPPCKRKPAIGKRDICPWIWSGMHRVRLYSHLISAVHKLMLAYMYYVVHTDDFAI
jgi:hypothetical protein